MIEKFPSRFMIGSDIVGHFAGYPHEMQKYYKLMDALKPETAKEGSEAATSLRSLRRNRHARLPQNTGLEQAAPPP